MPASNSCHHVARVPIEQVRLAPIGGWAAAKGPLAPIVPSTEVRLRSTKQPAPTASSGHLARQKRPAISGNGAQEHFEACRASSASQRRPIRHERELTLLAAQRTLRSLAAHPLGGSAGPPWGGHATSRRGVLPSPPDDPSASQGRVFRFAQTRHNWRNLCAFRMPRKVHTHHGLCTFILAPPCFAGRAIVSVVRPGPSSL